MVDQMMTSSITSHDLESRGHDPNMFNARYFENGSR